MLGTQSRSVRALSSSTCFQGWLIMTYCVCVCDAAYMVCVDSGISVVLQASNSVLPCEKINSFCPGGSNRHEDHFVCNNSTVF